MELIETVGPFLAAYLILSLLIYLWYRYRNRPVPDAPEGDPYRVYTREFDLELRADEVPARLESASPDFERGHLETNDYDLAEAIRRLDDVLAAQRAAFDAGHVHFMDRLRDSTPDADPRDMIVMLLIDQSGSMKGEPIRLAAVAAALVAEWVEAFGAKSEVLGFSTAGWRGGHPYMRWLKSGRPAYPGRLCALMHVIYKSADDPELSRDARNLIVHPDLLRENIDGESLEWAWGRLAARPESRKLLMVISDGAPVDDATLARNGPNYLYRHLMAVLEQLRAEPSLVLGAIGLAHRVDAWYDIAETVASPEKVPGAAARLLERMLAARRDT